MNHNNSCYVLAQQHKTGCHQRCIEIDYHSERSGRARCISRLSRLHQIGYHPTQDKEAVIEIDIRDNRKETARIIRIDADGEKVVKNVTPANWGKLLRYNYLKVNFTRCKGTGAL